jgi:hypothetical protein
MGGMKMPPLLFSALPLLLTACSPPAPAPASVPAAHVHAQAQDATRAAKAPIEHEATADTQGSFGDGKPVSVSLHVHDAAGAPMGPDQFQTVHEQKLHVLVVDPSLSDYRHVHPEYLGNGEWRFSFLPRFDRPYRLWLDATPVGGSQHYAMVTINQAGERVPAHKLLASRARMGDLEATLSFDTPPRAGEMAAARIDLSRDGKPFAALEPVMGAYAHIVGIGEDWASIAHVHPLGAGPHAPGDRGGPQLRFHLEPARPGYLALWAQLRVDGKDVFIPFGIEVQPGT